MHIRRPETKKMKDFLKKKKKTQLCIMEQ